MFAFLRIDSDYQLGSAAQTPGLNNSGATAEYEVPTSQHITPLAEAYIARDRAYASQHVSKPKSDCGKYVNLFGRLNRLTNCKQLRNILKARA